MNVLALKQAYQKALEQLEDLPANMPVNLISGNGLQPLKHISVYYTNAEGNEQEAGEECVSVTVLVE